MCWLHTSSLLRWVVCIASHISKLCWPIWVFPCNSNPVLCYCSTIHWSPDGWSSDIISPSRILRTLGCNRGDRCNAMTCTFPFCSQFLLQSFIYHANDSCSHLSCSISVHFALSVLSSPSSIFFVWAFLHAMDVNNDKQMNIFWSTFIYSRGLSKVCRTQCTHGRHA